MNTGLVRGAIRILKACLVLSRDGWTQHKYHCEGKHCVLGAIGWDKTKSFKGPVQRAVDELEDTVGPASAWNDAPRRTKVQVIAALNKTIKRLEKQVSK